MSHKFNNCRRPICPPRCEPQCPPRCKPIKPPKVRVTNLVTNRFIPNVTTDPQLINSWGIILINGNLTVADNGTGLVTTYTVNGIPLTPTVAVPDPNGDPASPTGLVANNTTGFPVTNGGLAAPAVWLTATENGTINAYNPTIFPTTAPVVVDNSASGTVYKGLTIANGYLYAADFHNNKIDVFSSNYTPVIGFPFADPNLPINYAPFNIYNINNQLYVTYALQKPPDNDDDQAGPGNGYINVFTVNGQLIRRLVSRGALNSPWGIVLAPFSFKLPLGTILVGNFGDGKINVYDRNGVYLGFLIKCDRTPLVLDGLWGLVSGSVYYGGSDNTIFFASGPDDEENGLVGKITADCDSVCFNRRY